MVPLRNRSPKKALTYGTPVPARVVKNSVFPAPELGLET